MLHLEYIEHVAPVVLAHAHRAQKAKSNYNYLRVFLVVKKKVYISNEELNFARRAYGTPRFAGSQWWRGTRCELLELALFRVRKKKKT